MESNQPPLESDRNEMLNRALRETGLDRKKVKARSPSQKSNESAESVSAVQDRIAGLRHLNETLEKLTLQQKEIISSLQGERSHAYNCLLSVRQNLLIATRSKTKWVLATGASCLLALTTIGFWASEHSEHQKTKQDLDRVRDKNHALFSRIILDQDTQSQKRTERKEQDVAKEQDPPAAKFELDRQ